MAAQEEADVVFEARQHNVLVPGVAREDDLVGIDVVFGGGVDFLRIHEPCGQAAEYDDTGNAKRASGGELAGEKKGAPQRDDHIDDAEQESRAHQPETRHQQDRKQQGRTQCAQVVERQHMRDHVAELVTSADNPHEERNLESDQHADDDHQHVHDQLKSLGICEGQKQQGGREAADDAEQKLDPDETIGKPAVDVAGNSAPDPHGKQVAADDGRELKHTIAEQIAGERARYQFVDEPAGGDQQDRNEEKNAHLTAFELVHGRGNNDTDADGHGSDQHRQGSVVLLHHLLPQ